MTGVAGDDEYTHDPSIGEYHYHTWARYLGDDKWHCSDPACRAEATTLYDGYTGLKIKTPEEFNEEQARKNRSDTERELQEAAEAEASQKAHHIIRGDPTDEATFVQMMRLYTQGRLE